MTPEIFRQRYPHGGLISELAAIEHGQFIVRVVVEIEGKKLASGLAAAPSVEQAEDQARIRALNLLGSGVMPAPKPAPQAVAPANPTSKITPELPAAPVIPVPPPMTANPAPTPAAAANIGHPSQTPALESLPLELIPPPQTPPAPSPEAEARSGTVETLDFSDIIARSDVELKRLGWSSEQGRTYLLETYGKRSRQLLSDDELLEFLQYLEAQPTPIS
ncbi:hypothetical protein FLX56_20570 [Synechococcus moorigangaii CMS01]|nr:hypothetical protein [Synechococcus moorigangaii CMS01]